MIIFGYTIDEWTPFTGVKMNGNQAKQWKLLFANEVSTINFLIQVYFDDTNSVF